MKNWYAYFQFNGDGITKYIEQEFPVSDDLYKKINDAIEDNEPLKYCEFYDDLYERAECSLDPELLWDEDDRPLREYYDTDEEYENDLNEYKREQEDRYCLVETIINDPGDDKRLCESFANRSFSAYATGEEHTESFDFEENDERYVRYIVDVSFDAYGKITDVEVCESEGLEWEGVRSSQYSHCYPNYFFVEEYLEDILNEEE